MKSASIAIAIALPYITRSVERLRDIRQTHMNVWTVSEMYDFPALPVQKRGQTEVSMVAISDERTTKRSQVRNTRVSSQSHKHNLAALVFDRQNFECSS